METIKSMLKVEYSENRREPTVFNEYRRELASSLGLAAFQRSALKVTPAWRTSPWTRASDTETRRISVDAAGSGRLFQVRTYYWTTPVVCSSSKSSIYIAP